MPDRPHCPRCDARLLLISVEPVNAAVGIHHLQCPRCDHAEQTATLELVRPADGWSIDTRRPASVPAAPSMVLPVSLPWSNSMSAAPVPK